MTPDISLLTVLLASFALLATVHAVLVIGLGGRSPRWRALAAMLVPPLAPWWGWQVGMRARCACWFAAAAVYAVALALAAR